MWARHNIVRTHSYLFKIYTVCWVEFLLFNNFKQQTQKNHNPWFSVFFFLMMMCFMPRKMHEHKKNTETLLRMVIYNGNLMGVVFYYNIFPPQQQYLLNFPNHSLLIICLSIHAKIFYVKVFVFNPLVTPHPVSFLFALLYE